MKWLPTLLVCLLLAVGVSAADRWPATGGGGFASANFFVRGGAPPGVVNNCLQYGIGDSTTAIAITGTFTQQPCQTAASPSRYTTMYFPIGVNVSTTHLACTVACTGCGVGETLTLRPMFRQGDALNVRTLSAVSLVLTPNGFTPLDSVRSVAAPLTCPYAANGCAMNVRIVASTLTGAGPFDLNCNIIYKIN